MTDLLFFSGFPGRLDCSVFRARYRLKCHPWGRDITPSRPE
ncbi:MAG: hypothetical protein N4A61_12645 [Pelagimonas sp.]|nr:hypothetical protein [Pelagimonas sp.]